MSEYLVIYEQGEDGGWGAYIPDIPNVTAVGESHDEVARLIREGVEIYLEEIESPSELPSPASIAETISI